MHTPPPAASRTTLSGSTWLAILVCCVGAFFGWRLLWHMADDAYITFRYVHNAMVGRGLVWNPEPFAPVDGNTDFLWSLLMLFVWKLGGILPPDSSNPMSLLFGFATLLLLGRAAERLPLPERLQRWRPALVWLVLLSVTGNRAFLASLSSGRGIAIFNFCLFAWALLASSPRTFDSPRRWLALGLAAAACGLCRPEGHLVVAGTCALLLCWSLPQRRVRGGLLAIAAAALPILAHLVWRRLTFGDWMPCPYYAKTVEAWPESGVRFFGSFVIEFGVYVWIGVAIAWSWRQVRDGRLFAMLRRERLGTSAVVGVMLFHFGYFTLFMGGDLFEWRVYSHLVPLLPLSLVVMARDLSPRPVFVAGTLGLSVVLALPVAWIKYRFDDGDVAPHLPGFLQPLVRPYDDWQRWLNQRAVCMRNFHMKQNFAVFERQCPSREEGERIPLDGFPVYATPTVGLIGWVLPNVAIIDLLGLNDLVIARTEVPTAPQRLERRTRTLNGEFDAFDKDRDQRVTQDELRPFLAALRPEVAARPDELERAVTAELGRYDVDGDGFVTRGEYVQRGNLHGDRLLAHDRSPPPGYVAGFRPNVEVFQGTVTVKKREVPLTEQEIRQHEGTFRAHLGTGR
ncbi:MAG TPA: EF-hand domain-containing protein [Planctomycetota bacterium]